MKPTCAIPDCINLPIARDYCAKHYDQKRDDTKKDTAQFRAQLLEAMATRGMTVREVAEAINVQPTTVQYWRAGTVVPQIERADRLADVLDWEQLRTLVMAIRARRCIRCKKRYYAGDIKSKYCGTSCARAFQRDRRNKVRVQRRTIMLDRFKQAIAAHCADCAPERLCRDSECHLRPVSPLPFVPIRMGARRVA